MKAGWGDWASPSTGTGVGGISQRTLNKRDKLLKIVDETSSAKRAQRRDLKIADVMLSERRIKATAKFKIAEIPHPFKSREEYERSIQMPIGGI